MKFLFNITVSVDTPIVVGQDDRMGRRQLIPILSGKVEGKDMEGRDFIGECLPGGVDSQVIRPDGKCELSARYGVKLTEGEYAGASFYIENNGIRTVPEAYVETVLKGGFIDPSLYYFTTVPSFEIYDERLKWMEKYIFMCKAVREPDCVRLQYYVMD